MDVVLVFFDFLELHGQLLSTSNSFVDDPPVEDKLSGTIKPTDLGLEVILASDKMLARTTRWILAGGF